MPITRPQWDTMTPYGQGYHSYMYSSWPGSDIPAYNPYIQGSEQFKAFQRGEFAGMLAAKDSED